MYDTANQNTLIAHHFTHTIGKITHFMLFWVLSTMPARTVYGRSLDVFCWSHCTPLSFSSSSAVTQRRRVSACCVGAWPARCIQSDSFLLLALELCPAWVSSLPSDLIKHRKGFWLPTIPHKHRNKSCQSGSLQMYVHYFVSWSSSYQHTHTLAHTHTHTRTHVPGKPSYDKLSQTKRNDFSQ